MSTPSEPKSRKFPLPCWTHDETQALISVYKDRWAALSRSNLKAADWDSVADAVALRCPFVSPPKTALQCRCKMEKLRRRYRSEKERASTYPGRFLSSWDMFQTMVDLEGDSPLDFGYNPAPESRVGVKFGGGYRVRNDETYRHLADSDQNLSDPDEETPKGAGFGGGFQVKDGAFDRNVGQRSDVAYGFPIKSLGDRNLGPSDFRSTKNYGKTNVKVNNPKPNSKPECGYGVGTRSGFDLKSRKGLDSNGVGFEDLGGGKEVDDDGIEQMASSIGFLGEVFVRMEKRKIEMAREMVKMRMDMEMKQTEVIIEAQQRMLNACVDALLESKKKKKMKINVVPLDS